MAAATYDPITLQSILQQLPEMQRRKKQAERLRRSATSLSELGAPQESRNYTPTQSGGLFQTVGQYTPDYSGIGRAAAQIGGWYLGNKADQEESGYSDAQQAEILKTVERIGAGNEGGASDQALRAYLGLLGGPDVKDILGKQAHTSGRQVDKDGFIWVLDSAGNWTNSGIQAAPKTQVLNIPGQLPQIADLSGAKSGTARDIQFGGAATPPFDNAQRTPDAQADEAERWYQAVEAQESGSDQNAVSPKGATGVMQLMPSTARALEKALNMAPGTTDTDADANRKAGRLFLDQRMQARNGDRILALMDYNWGQGNVDKWIASGADPRNVPQETRDYVRKVSQRATGQQAAPAAGPAPAGQEAFRLPTEAQKAQQAQAGKIAAELAAAPATAAAAAQQAGVVEQRKVDEKTAGEARAKLPNMELASEELDLTVDTLLKHKGLDQIVGRSIGGLVPDEGLGADTGQLVYKGLMAGTPAAGALAQHMKLRGQVMKDAYESIRGAGQITEYETKFASQALAAIDRSQNKQEYVAAVKDFQRAYRSAVNRMKMVAAGQYAAPGVFIDTIPAAPAAAPADPRAALRAKYGL